MLKSSILKKAKSVGFSIKKVQEAFVAVCREALEDLGGPEWESKSDLRHLFRQLEQELKRPLCVDADGPMLSNDSFKKYMSAARKSLLFKVPFTMSYQVSYEDLPKVKAAVEADSRAVDEEQKVKEAIKALRIEKRELQKKNIQFVKIELPDEENPERWAEDLFTQLSELLEREEVKKQMPANPALYDLAAVVMDCRSEVNA